MISTWCIMHHHSILHYRHHLDRRHHPIILPWYNFNSASFFNLTRHHPHHARPTDIVDSAHEQHGNGKVWRLELEPETGAAAGSLTLLAGALEPPLIFREPQGAALSSDGATLCVRQLSLLYIIFILYPPFPHVKKLKRLMCACVHVCTERRSLTS